MVKKGQSIILKCLLILHRKSLVRTIGQVEFSCPKHVIKFCEQWIPFSPQLFILFSASRSGIQVHQHVREPVVHQ